MWSIRTTAPSAAARAEFGDEWRFGKVDDYGLDPGREQRPLELGQSLDRARRRRSRTTAPPSRMRGSPGLRARVKPKWS